jgi:type II secretory pathway component PulF
MASFSYKARMLSGGITQGTIEAADQKAAVDQIRGQKLMPLEVLESEPPLLERLKIMFPMKVRVKPKDLVLFSRQLSTLVSAGVPLVQGLTILEDQVEAKSFKSIIHTIREDIEKGQ